MFFDGGVIVQISPKGTIMRRIKLPVLRPTSCSFGDGDQYLYITSARLGLSESELADRFASGAFAQDRLCRDKLRLAHKLTDGMSPRKSPLTGAGFLVEALSARAGAGTSMNHYADSPPGKAFRRTSILLIL